MGAISIRYALFFLVFSISCEAYLLVAREQPIRFTDMTQEAALQEPLAGMMGHAAAWGDVDGDGDLDLYVGGFSDRPDAEYSPAPGPVANRLLRNLSNGRFERVLNPAIEFYGRTSHAVFVDLNNDGLLDLYVANNTRRSSRVTSGPQRDAQLRRPNLFFNQSGNLVEIGAASGACVTAPGSARSTGVLDYDADGLLDLLVVEDRFAKGSRSRLCRNLGDFRFEDVTSKAGLPDNLFGLGLAIADLNEDGRPDIFVTDSNRLFLSAGRVPYIEPTAPEKVLAWEPLDSEDWPAGAAFADLNRDHRLDLVVGIHHERARNRVYLNEGLEGGVPKFRDVSVQAGIPAQLSTKSPHVEVQDFDNDGWPDIYFSSAWLDADGAVTPLVFRNLGVQGGVPRFEPLRSLSDSPHVYFPAGPSGDYDADGRVDLFLVNWFRGNRSRLLKNVSDPNRWLEIAAVGRTTNRMGIGAKVRVYKAGELGRDTGLLGFQEIGTGYGFGSGQPAVAHFGLGSQIKVDVEITFPDGARAVLKDVKADQRLKVAER